MKTQVLVFYSIHVGRAVDPLRSFQLFQYVLKL